MAVHVTMVSPNGNTSGASLVTESISDISSTMEFSRTTTFSCSDIASTIIDSGAVMLGAIVSTIVTNCVLDMEFPEVSVAVHVTMVSPNGKNSGASFSIAKTPTISELCASPRITEFDAMSSAS